MNTSIQRRIALAMLGIGLYVAGTSTPVNAQTRLQDPDTVPDLSRYLTVEQCNVAVERTSQYAINQQPQWIDTLQVSKRQEYLSPLPPSAVALAKECSAKFDPDTVPISNYAEYQDWIHLFLSAKQDSALDILEGRKLAEVSRPDVKPSDRFELLGRMVVSYMLKKPMRWDRMLSLMERADAYASQSDMKLVLVLYANLFGVAAVVGDMDVQQQFAEKIIAIVNDLPPQDRRKVNRGLVASAYDFLNRESLLDSLANGSEGYVAFKQANWNKAGSAPAPLPIIGKRAPQIVADFWFAPGSPSTKQSGDLTLQRPTLGKVSLVVFLGEGCRDDSPLPIYLPLQKTHRRDLQTIRDGGCWETYAVMRRLAQQFPDLEMTIVAQTAGFIGSSLAADPKEEAELLRSWWLGFHQVSAALAVATTPFFKLPAPDGRRIDQPVKNTENYLFGMGKDIALKTAYLIDREGTILKHEVLARENEEAWTLMLAIVLNQK